MKKLILLLFIGFIGVTAQENEELFNVANTFYKDGVYEKAIESYERLIKEDKVSSELYYNLGNCFYKLNKVAPAIYNFEKALQLNPNNKDAQNNLIFAKRLTIDRIEELPKSIFQKIDDSYLSKLHYNTWGVLTIVLAFLVVMLFLLFYFSFNSVKKRLFFSATIISFILLIISFSIGFQQYKKEINTVIAIVFSAEVSVQSEPTNDASEAFVLHEGAKVLIIDAVDEWSKIKLIDGKIGWLKSVNIKMLSKS